MGEKKFHVKHVPSVGDAIGLYGFICPILKMLPYDVYLRVEIGGSGLVLETEKHYFDDLYAGETLEFSEETGKVTIVNKAGTVTRNFSWDTSTENPVINYGGILTLDPGSVKEEVWEVKWISDDFLTLTIPEEDFDQKVEPIDNCCYGRTISKSFTAQ